MDESRPTDRARRVPRPIDGARLNELALAYVARFATSSGKLADYLKRKLRERGWEGRDDGSAPPDIAAIVERMVAAGYVDDAVYARAKGGGLLRRGYGERRIAQALGAAGIAEPDRAGATGDAAERRSAALHMARKRGFGPFARGPFTGGSRGAELPDPAQRQKQVMAMLRAGHPLESARKLVDAASIEAAELWAGEAQEGDADE
ncbi:regulatory protein RecX [Novosphingobium lentum]|uniref:regulatory protein RecX n=1 Tax=Novosphingobium lentum TaxID=145287 RepID=UPI00082B8947|nr:RecX family transcriptional regulator [Novosphingobium lentum]